MADTNKIVDINHNQKVAAKLQEFLAQSYATLLQIQNLHWNIEGPNFYGIHKLTEEFYQEQFAAIDDIAERIRTLGHKAQVSFKKYDHDSHIENEATVKAAIAAQESAAQTASELISIAEEIGDEGTVDIATQRLQVHQKNAWMLKSQAK